MHTVHTHTHLVHMHTVHTHWLLHTHTHRHLQQHSLSLLVQILVPRIARYQFRGLGQHILTVDRGIPLWAWQGPLESILSHVVQFRCWDVAFVDCREVRWDRRHVVGWFVRCGSVSVQWSSLSVSWQPLSGTDLKLCVCGVCVCVKPQGMCEMCVVCVKGEGGLILNSKCSSTEHYMHDYCTCLQLTWSKIKMHKTCDNVHKHTAHKNMQINGKANRMYTFNFRIILTAAKLCCMLGSAS